MSSQPQLPSGYSLQEGPPLVGSYIHLRRSAGLTPVTSVQAEGAISTTWYGVHIVHNAENGETEIVGMGRIIGGGWYFHVADIAVLPTHQRKGLGHVIMTALLSTVKEKAEPGYYINLLADPPGRKLYQRLGFKESMPREMGMGMWVGGKGEVKGSSSDKP